MLLELSFAQLGRLYEGDVMCECDSLWNLKPQCHIEGNMSCINLGWTKCDVTDVLRQGLTHVPCK